MKGTSLMSSCLQYIINFDFASSFRNYLEDGYFTKNPQDCTLFSQLHIESQYSILDIFLSHRTVKYEIEPGLTY